MSRLLREDFFGHEKIAKLANQISKKTKQKIKYLNIRDPELIQLLIDNIDWLDYIGIIIKHKKDNTITIRWEIQ